MIAASAPGHLTIATTSAASWLGHVSPAGIVFLAPGGLFELLFPLLLIVRGFSAGGRAHPGPVRR